jgi:hypothetical protein
LIARRDSRRHPCCRESIMAAKLRQVTLQTELERSSPKATLMVVNRSG